MHPHLDLIDQLIRIFGWPALLSALVWAVRKWDKTQTQFHAMNADTTETRRMVMETLGAVDTIKTNHLAHLQSGISEVAQSNNKAVEILTEIDKNIAVLVDRSPRG